jgi:hypothetical protein
LKYNFSRFYRLPTLDKLKAQDKQSFNSPLEFNY